MQAYQAEESRELQNWLASSRAGQLTVQGAYGLLLCKITRSTENNDDGVVLELHGAAMCSSQL